MKISTLLLIVSLFEIHANSYSQNTKISLNHDEISIGDVFKEIEQKSEFRFLYKNKEIDIHTKVSIHVTKKNIYEILNNLLSELPITYEILDNRQIILSKLPPKIIKPKNDLPIATKMQQTKINGIVIDENGLPLAGANILEKGTTNGTQTDFDGNFSIEVANKDAILLVSYIGYTTKEVFVNKQVNFTIQLEANTAALEEVVVVGFGTQKKANLTGSVSTVSSKSLENRPVTSFTSALQGTAAGLNITQTSGQPGQEALSIQIRGASSANGNVDPLVIIDGINSSTTALSQTLNPNDIESVTILKDAAAASIYGAQAAGGVILIKTKSGTPGKVKFDYSSQISSSWSLNLPERLTLLEEAEYSNLARANAGSGPEYNDAAIENIKNGVQYVPHSTNPNQYIYYNTKDKRDEILRKTSFMQNHNLRVSGGNEKTIYMASFGFLQQNGVFKIGPDKFKKYNTRINLNTELTKNISLNSKISYAVHNREQPSQDTDGYSLFQYLSQTRSRYPIFTPEGRLAGGDNTYGVLAEGGYTDKVVNELDGVFTATFKNLIKGLEFRSIYGRKLRTFDYERFKRTVTFWGKNTPINYLNNPNSLELLREIITRNNFQFLTDYDVNLNKHHLHVLVGYQWEDYRRDRTDSSVKSLVVNDLPTLNIGEPTTQQNSQFIQTYATQSYFGRLNYDFDGKYLIEATIRSDETSRLAPNSRVNLFPSASIGWNIHKENWFINALPFINEFKPRASWGQLGNANGDIIGYYDYLSLLQSGSNLVLGTNEDRATYFYQNSVPSSTLAWETVETSNVGIDIGLFNHKLQFGFDYYVKNNNNMLIPLDLPGTFGINAPKVNEGKLKTWGWELSTNYRDKISKNMNFSFGFNVSDSQNELVDYGEGNNIIKSGENKLVQGYPLNTIWGYNTKPGYIQNQEQLDNAPFYNNKTGIGDIEYIDQDGNKQINAGGGTTEDPGDLVLLGDTQPRFLYGINMAINYKTIDFSFFLQGAGKRNYMPLRDMLMPYGQTWFTAQKHHLDYWTPENPNAAFPRPFLQGTHNYAPSDRWVLNASYLRVKNIQLGYTLPQKALDAAKLSNLRFFISLENAFTFSKLGVFKGVFDPEQKNNVRADYPLFGFAAFGINLSF